MNAYYTVTGRGGRIRRRRNPALSLLSFCAAMLVAVAGQGQTITFTSTPYAPGETAAKGAKGVVYNYSALAEASDGSPVQYALRFGPTGMKVNEQSGLVTWNPTVAGEVDVEVRAELAGDPSVNAVQRWKIAVEDLTKHPGCTGNDVWLSPGDGISGGGKGAVVMGNDLYVYHNTDADWNWEGGSSLSRWNGSYWTTLASHNEFDSAGQAMAAYHGEIYIAGMPMDLPNVPNSQGLIRWTGSGWSGVPGHDMWGVFDMEVYDDGLYVLGYNRDQQGMRWQCIVTRWDGTGWTDVHKGALGTVKDLALLDGKLYMAGSFTNVGASADASFLAEITNDQVVSVTNPPDGTVYRITPHQGGLVLVQLQGKATNRLSIWTPSGITPIDPNSYLVQFNPPMISHNGALYVAVREGGSKAPLRTLVWRLSAGEWFPVSALSSDDYEMGMFGMVNYEDELFTYGTYRSSCGIPLSNIARLCREGECGRVSGTVYMDEDRDCSRGQGEVGLAGELVEFQPGSYYATTDAQGIYSTFIPVGTYTAELAVKRHWVAPCTASQSVTLATAGSEVEGIDFGTDMIPGIYDVQTSVASGLARPGRGIVYTVLCRNVGTEPASGSLAFTYDDRLDLRAATATPDRQNGNILEWDFTRLDVGEDLVITVTLNIPTTIQRGETLCAFAEANFEKRDDDRLLSDNLDSSCTEVRTSYDPNDIRVTPHRELGELGYETLLPNDSVLTYMVRFQNTGNDTAFRVVVRDTLGVDLLEVASIELGASSHGYEFSISGHGELEWRFENILLPDSGASEVGSHGYFKYRVRLKRGLGPLTEIANRASIYFDYNEPVMTNTVVSVTNSDLSSVAEEAGVGNVLQVYPNPARGRSMIGLHLETGADVRLRLVDTKGAIIRDLMERKLDAGTHSMELETGGLASGLYFITLERGGKKEVFPVVIGR